MSPVLLALFSVLTVFFHCTTANIDLDTAALTVYRNPDFFRHLSEEFNNHLRTFSGDPPNYYGPRDEYQSPAEDQDNYFHHFNHQYNNKYPDERDNQQNHENDNNDEEQQKQNGESEEEYNSEVPENHSDRYRHDDVENEEQKEQDDDGYKYPGEPKKPNPPGSPNVNVHFDGSPDFHHPPRNLPPPKKPRKKGRGPYGHPQYAKQDYPNYHEELEDIKHKTEEELLADIEEESRKQRLEDESRRPPPEETYVDPRQYPIDEYREDKSQLPLKIFHHGQRYPVHHTRDTYPNNYRTQEEIQFPLESEDRRPTKHQLYPIDEFRETKKGTREYLKHHKLPSNHELEDFRSEREKRPEKLIKTSCNTVVKPKKRKKYIAYRVRPIYSKYRIIPFKPKKMATVYFTRPIVNHRRSHLSKVPSKRIEDDSAYIINSELDHDHQQIKFITG